MLIHGYDGVLATGEQLDGEVVEHQGVTVITIGGLAGELHHALDRGATAVLTVTGPEVALRLDDDDTLLRWVRHSAGGCCTSRARQDRTDVSRSRE